MSTADSDSPFAPAVSTLPPNVPNVFRTQLLVGTGERAVLDGVMGRIWVRWPWFEPAARILGAFGLLPGRTGVDVPVTLTIEGKKGRHGWAKQVWRRRFGFPRPRRMTTSTVFDPSIGAAVDRLGPMGGFELVWGLDFAPPETLTLAGTHWRLRLGPVTLPLPSKLIGLPTVVHTALTEDRVHVAFSNSMPVIGEVFGYDGTFSVQGEKRG